MPPPPRSAGTRRSPGRSRTSASSSSWVPRPTTRPSSSTTIRSASRIVETRWATITTVASRGHRPQRRPQPGVGGQVERGERVVEEVDLGPADHRPGDGEPLPLAAGDVGAALGDRRRRGRRASRATKSRGLGDLAARPRSPRRWRRACRSAGWRRRCRRRGRPAAAPGRSATTAARGRGRGRRRRRPARAPPVASKSRGTRLTRVRLAGAGRADDRDGLARARRRGDVAQDRRLGAGIGEARRRRGRGRRAR